MIVLGGEKNGKKCNQDGKKDQIHVEDAAT